MAPTDRWLPWAFIIGEVVGLTVTGLLLRRSLRTLFLTVASVGALAVFCGGFIPFAIAAEAGCFA